MRGAWPAAELGPLVGWWLEVPDSAAPVVRIEHLGPRAGAAAEALLSRVVAERTGTSVAVRTRAYPWQATSAALADGEAWLASLRAALESAQGAERLYACVTVPADTLLPPRSSRAEVVRRVRDEAAQLGARAAVAADGEGWSVRLAAAPCAPAAAAAGPPAPAAGAAERALIAAPETLQAIRDSWAAASTHEARREDSSVLP